SRRRPLVSVSPAILAVWWILLLMLALPPTAFGQQVLRPLGQESDKESAASEITNPFIRERADPWCLRHTDGHYYFTATVPAYDRIELRRAATLAGLARAEPRVIWRKHESGPMSYHIWAPEIHAIDGQWYIYFAAGRAEDIWAIRIYVLACTDPDPLTGTWREKGQLKTNWESFSLDATTFAHRGGRYLVWAQKDPRIRGNTNLYIGRMDTPWSIAGRQVLLTKPQYDWEQIGFWVNEGPAALVRNNRVFLSYSASATDHNYCMGLLTAAADADLLDPNSWTKSPQPVFRSSPAHSQYGPGHNSFTTTDDGKTDVLVYHARNYKEIQGDPLRNPDRHTRIQILRWKPDGSPDLGEPVTDGPLQMPKERP
ncbi:MAG: glycoside hydrolase family 43 protein, partial [Sedimentisphaerales bacterium]|nr:glycoside hydrolase family 43 protein [Sedimentisphaerales bacterium]